MEKDVNLTPSRIDQLERGAIFDPEIPGLCVIVLGPGKKVWRFKRRIARTKTIIELNLLFRCRRARVGAPASRCVASCPAVS